ncbi:MAG: glycosyltransferase [Thermaerobacter sp.]|nr:glycosyltransferase [Thermaerobacter sp.]
MVIPVLNQLETTAATWELLRRNSTAPFQLVVVDNGSTDDIPSYLERQVRPAVAELRVLRNAENVGVVAALRQGCAAADGEIVACLHNDLHIYERGWDQRVLDLFARLPFLGMAGFHGSRGTSNGGSRVEPCSNLVNAENHGARLQRAYLPVVLLDGCCLIFRRECLERTGGFDPHFRYHHFYDCDASLASLAAGYRNAVVGVSCYHPGGTTSCSPAYRRWIDERLGGEEGDRAEFDRNFAYLQEKWSWFMPVYAEEDFTLRHELP